MEQMVQCRAPRDQTLSVILFREKETALRNSKVGRKVSLITFVDKGLSRVITGVVLPILRIAVIIRHIRGWTKLIPVVKLDGVGSYGRETTVSYKHIGQTDKTAY